MINNEKNYCVNYRYTMLPIAIFIVISLFLAVGFSFSQYSRFIDAYTSWQQPYFLWINNVSNQVISSEMWGRITLLGDKYVLLLILSPLLLWKPKVWLSILTAAPIAAILGAIGKKLLSMPRPAMVIEHHNFNIIGELATGYKSLPSGHSLTIFTGFMVLIILVYTNLSKKQSKCSKYGAIILDVFFGGLCGWVSAYCGIYILYGREGKHNSFYQQKGVIIISAIIAIITLLLAYRYYQHPDIVSLFAVICGILTSSSLAYKRLKMR